MVLLPASLASFVSLAEKAIAQGCIKEIEFSGSTYQVLVEDPKTKTNIWVFLQIDDKESIKDSFCTCDESYESSTCIHLAIAFLGVYGNFPTPLHDRFSLSLWNHLCRLYSDRLGRSLNLITKVKEGYYLCRSKEGQTIFSIQAKSHETIFRLEQILEFRPRETEETSLKFSNLPQEELQLWRSGNPSPQLSYELSFWGDLAKWLILKQEKGQAYDITFQYDKNGLPSWITISFPDIIIEFALDAEDLPFIIPSLNTVKSPLSVYEADLGGMTKITYDKKSGCLSIKGIEQDIKNKTSGYILNGWRFIPGDGFYAQKPHILLEKPTICGIALSGFLNKYHKIVSKYIEGLEIQSDPFRPSYELFFDSKWNLNISIYLFEPGDLSKGDSRLIGDWAFLDGKGFYRLEAMRFDEIKKIITSNQVPEFISQNRVWLNSQEGFQTHISSIDCPIAYNLSSNNRLTFFQALSIEKDEGKSRDFGTWIYWQGRGFYPKAKVHQTPRIQTDLSLSGNQIPLFIRMNREELSLVPKFFSEHCPVLRGGLSITLLDDTKINVKPEFEIIPDYRTKNVKFFEDFVFVEGEGFHDLPFEARLPEQFNHSIVLQGDELEHFITHELDDLNAYILQKDPRLIKPKKLNPFLSTIVNAPEREKGWYKIDLRYQTEKGSISISTLWHAIKRKKTFLFDPAGLIDLRDKSFDWIRHLKKDQIDDSTKSIFLSSLEIMRLHALDPLSFIPTGDEIGLVSQKNFDTLTGMTTPEEPDIEGLESQLRPYQKLGVRWLWFLYRQHLSGLLCDDMGLGKTHQTMGLFAAVTNFFHRYAQGVPLHFLVVCPTSVIYHWKEKLNTFLPNLRVCIFYGSQRTLEEFHDQYDILITSYGILRIETELLSKIPFEVAVYDEIQLAKNQTSRIYAALLKIKAQMRLGLTGTPIENRLRELKSLFDVVIPHYMPNETDYRQLFIKPIEKENDSKRKELLTRFIKPFVLRRKKEEVLLDLPEKIEEITLCDLLPQQQELYIQLLAQRRESLVHELADENKPIPFLHIFALLSSLKQICNHPAVYLKEPLEYRSYQSGKWDSFQELLMEARESNQKVVVFSQYLGMLDIIEAYLTDNEIGFAAVRGSTLRRHEQIDKFNQDPHCEVFVGSLQAVGLGIDLTAGSVVIHYDRWWNAARENQATDRVHRIGQTRGVQVFKLVTKGTFEEKIDQMITRKGRLMEDVVGIDDANTLKNLNRHDLMELLQLVNPTDASG